MKIGTDLKKNIYVTITLQKKQSIEIWYVIDCKLIDCM